jgi:hypothetical protein
VHRCEESTLGRPLYERFCPSLPVYDGLGLILLLVPEDTDVLGTVHDELVTALVVAQPPAQVLLLLEWRNLGLLVVLVDAALSSIALNVGELVDGDSVLLVERGSVQGFAGGDGLCRCLVFDESVSSSLASGLIHGHEDVVLLGLAGGGELAQQELDKFGPAVFGDLGQAIDHNKCVEALLHVDLILLAEICALSASPFHRASVWSGVIAAYQKSRSPPRRRSRPALGRAARKKAPYCL